MAMSPTTKPETASLKVMVKKPGAADFVVAPPGVTLPTGTQLYTLLRLDGPANVQFYQVDVRGKTNVIFPDSQISLKNPLPGGQEIRLPSNGVFELDDEDLGIEAASRGVSIRGRFPA